MWLYFNTLQSVIITLQNVCFSFAKSHKFDPETRFNWIMFWPVIVTG